MSTITTNFRAPAVARSSAQRAADGLIAGYIRSLAQVATAPAAEPGSRPKLVARAAQAYDCGARRSTGLANRRRPGLRRIPTPA